MPHSGGEKVQDASPLTRVPATGAESAQQPAGSARVVLVWLPRGSTVKKLAGLGMAPGLLSAGLGSVPAEQTYLDITQGNRIFDSLYDSELPSSKRCGANFWRAVDERADSAPADIVPGLLTSTLESAGVGVSVGGEASCTFSSPQPRTAVGAPPKKLSGTPHRHRPQTFEVRSSSLHDLSSLTEALHGEDMLIAIERPPPAKNEALAIGIAGRGFNGNLTSDSTRMDGYVLSTDVAPTILSRLDLAIPSEMSGQPIRTEGMIDAAAVESLGDRLSVISERRGPVIGLGLAIWLVGFGLAVAATRGRAARYGIELLGLSIVYLPLLLLFDAALEPGRAAEQLLTIAGTPLLALLTLAALPGYRALAVASGATVIAYAIDVIAGSALTSLSLLGPNPGLGVRFYGIGNELEAVLGVLVVAGTGAALSGFAPRLPAPRAAGAFLAVGLLSAFVFAAGRFGADVGAAIVLSLGAAAAAAAIAARRRRTALLVVAAPLAVLALLALADLLSGANAHLTRSVLDAGGLGDLADVAQRRLQLSSHSFVRPVVFAFLPLILVVAAWAIVWRDLIATWLRGQQAMRAGLIGAMVATLAGTLANDSGALLLEIGSAYLLVFVGFVWAENSAGGQHSPAQTKSYTSVSHARENSS
jgi:hypothetical protein